MNPILKKAGVIFGSLFIYLVLVLNTIQIISVLYIQFQPAYVEQSTVRSLNIWRVWVILGERFLGIQIRMVGDQPRTQNTLVIANHRAMTDILCLLSLAWRCGRLGDLKWFVKDEPKWVPVLVGG